MKLALFAKMARSQIRRVAVWLHCFCFKKCFKNACSFGNGIPNLWVPTKYVAA